MRVPLRISLALAVVLSLIGARGCGLGDTRDIRVRVRRAGSDEPVPGAEVFAGDTSLGVTGDSGERIVTLSSQGFHVLHAKAAGWRCARMVELAEATRRGPFGGQESVDIEMYEVGQLFVTCKRVNGERIDSVRVYVSDVEFGESDTSGVVLGEIYGPPGQAVVITGDKNGEIAADTLTVFPNRRFYEASLSFLPRPETFTVIVKCRCSRGHDAHERKEVHIADRSGYTNTRGAFTAEGLSGRPGDVVLVRVNGEERSLTVGSGKSEYYEEFRFGCPLPPPANVTMFSTPGGSRLYFDGVDIGVAPQERR